MLNQFTSSLSGVVRLHDQLLYTHKYFLLTAGHGSERKPDLIKLTCALANDDMVKAQETLGDKIMRMWPTNLDQKMKIGILKHSTSFSIRG